MSSIPLPRARYLLKLANYDNSNALASYVVGLLQAQGMQCLVDKQHVVVSADPGKLKTQASQTVR